MKKLAIVVAMSENRVIGRDNQLPWHLPEDLKFFKSTTTGHPIIMGRNTFESIGRPLPGRTNIVLTTNSQWHADGILIAKSIEEALMLAEGDANARSVEWMMLVGGANLYAQLLALCQRLYLTKVHAEIEGDAYFPSLDFRDWHEVSRVRHEPDANNPYPYSFITLDRKSIN